MKSLKNFIFVIAAVLFTVNVTAQNEQSAIYDAIALLNAKQGINVIMLPDSKGYTKIDPLSGKFIQGETADLSGGDINSVNSKSIIIQILARNAGLDPTSPTVEQDVRVAYASNPFLGNILDTPFISTSSGNFKLKKKIDKFETDSLSGAITDDILNNVANGAADFLIKRANEEISVAVIQKLKDFTAHYPEFEVIFPRTMALIRPVSAYEYAKMLNALKAALQEDLDYLPAHIPELYALPRYKELNQRVPLMTMIYATSSMLNALKDKNSISASIHHLGSADFLEANNNYSSFVRVLILLSDNLRKKSLAQDDNGAYDYIELSAIDKVTNNKLENKCILTKYFLGLLYQRGANISFLSSEGPKTASNLFEAWNTASDPQLSEFIDRVLNASVKLQEVSVKLKKIREYDDGLTQLSGKIFTSSEKFEAYSKIIGASLQLCEPFVSGSDASGALKMEFKRISVYWDGFSSHSIHMVSALSQKDYSLAVNDLSQMLALIDTYLKERQADKLPREQAITSMEARISTDIAALGLKIAALDVELAKIEALSTAMKIEPVIYDQKQGYLNDKKNLEKQIKELEWEKKNTEKFVFTLSKVIEYYQLFAALSQTESGKEVEALLDAYALPSGSSRIKKDMAFNITVNAYVGIFGRSDTEGDGFTNEYGLTAPIGFTFSHGLGKVGSISLFTGIFDIGGIIRYKLDNEGAYQQDIDLAGLISPSLQAVYGFPWYLPLSIGAGCQWTTPVTADSNDINLKPHFNAFLAVDIPLFNLNAKKKKRQ